MWIPALLVVCIAATAGVVALAVRAAGLGARVRQLDAIAPRALDAAENERRLAAVTREYDALLAYCGGGVLLISADDVIERVNLTARYLLGVPTLNMIGKTVLRGTLSSELYDVVKCARETRCIQRREIA